jgi:glycosyltransferase involved in cell wall biosynthesis
VKNEEEMLGACLESVKGVDAIFISDTGSTDNTVEVAKKFTDKVWTEDIWHDSFCDARNFIKAKATTDWILSIDGDEHLHDFAKVVEAVRLAEQQKVLAVDVTLISDDDVKQEHFFPRLFKNVPEVYWNGAIHNHLSVIGTKLGDVKITYGYSPAHMKDPDRALRILTKESAKEGGVRETFYLGRELFYRGKWQEAIDAMQRYVERSRFLAEKADAYLVMARAYWNTKRGEEARDACLQAIKINPHFQEACDFMAQLVWPHHAQQWKNMASTATNEDVLFKRKV